jgi:hypothetical protein
LRIKHVSPRVAAKHAHHFNMPHSHFCNVDHGRMPVFIKHCNSNILKGLIFYVPSWKRGPGHLVNGYHSCLFFCKFLFVYKLKYICLFSFSLFSDWISLWCWSWVQGKTSQTCMFLSKRIWWKPPWTLRQGINVINKWAYIWIVLFVESYKKIYEIYGL